MIFLDNAATTRQKPEVVHQAFSFYMREIGVTPGRGSYSLAIDASRMLYQARKTTAMFFGASGPDSVAFTKNSTEAINLFFKGYLKKGDVVLISPFEHNAVLSADEQQSLIALQHDIQRHHSPTLLLKR